MATGFLIRLETVRGLAALSVALGHTMSYLLVTNGGGGGLFDQPSARTIILKLIYGLLSGETAVIVFFVISGVVIGRSLDARRGTAAGNDLVSFMIRRVLRLYPAHIVTVVGIIGLAFIFLVGRAPIDFAAFPGTSPARNPDVAEWLNGKVFNPLKRKSVVGNLAMASWSMNWVAWSLYVEICAAPLLPLFHHLSRKANQWLDVAVLLALISLALLNWDHLWSRYLFVFYLGMMVESHGVNWARALERRLGGSRVAMVAIFLVMTLPNTLAADRSMACVLAEAFGAFGIISLVVTSEGRIPFRSLEHRLLRWNGRLSYSFYLWHFFIMTIVVRALYATLPIDVMSRFDIPIVVATAIITIAFALGIAQLSFSYIEVPSIGLGRTIAAAWRRVVERWQPRAYQPVLGQRLNAHSKDSARAERRRC